MAEEAQTQETSQTDANVGSADADERAGLTAALTAERRKRQALETQIAELRGRVEGMSASRGHSEPPQELSLSQIRRAVDEGRITEDEAEQLREQRVKSSLRAEIETSLRSEMTTQRTAQQVASGIAAYKAAIPELDDQDSPQFRKLQTEYQALIDLGYEADARTELAAARAAFGPSDKIKRFDAAPPQAHQETGGGSGEDLDQRTNDGAPKGLTPRLRDWYRDRIRAGMYKGWDDPVLKKELAYTNTGVAKRAQARASA